MSATGRKVSYVDAMNRFWTIMGEIGYKGKVFLSGSRARGDHRNDSDIDIVFSRGCLGELNANDFQGQLQKVFDGTGLDIGVEDGDTIESLRLSGELIEISRPRSGGERKNQSTEKK